ncbi:MAG: HAD-IA family hydrolase [Candidatus Aenigmarchaeota archaeon]|nr:HAD-IA family hydrolase [Candidatus Aenigmarchaeota archaeon]
MIKLILFDIDGTLIDSAEANWRFLNTLNKKYGGRQLVFEDYKKDFYAYPMRTVIKLCCPKIAESVLDEACKYGVSIYPEFHKLIKVNKNAVELLNKLYGNYKLGIVTSRIGTRIIDELGIRKFFQHIITFNDYKRPKPDPEPLLIAFERFNIKPENTVYIGDNQKDVDCSKSAGCKSIVFGDAAKGDWNIDDFLQVLKILKSETS